MSHVSHGSVATSHLRFDAVFSDDIISYLLLSLKVLSALMVLVGCQEEHPACKRLIGEEVYCIFLWLFLPVFDVCFLSTSQEIGWEEHLRNDVFCVQWDWSWTLCCSSVYQSTPFLQ